MELLSSILYYPVGFLYLWIRYRNKEKIKKVLKEKYNSSYYEAGFLSVGKVFRAVFL
jgi:3-deoxy-D-manno-octulosonic-acid transferase